jgi:hypothetical protein
LCKVSKPVSAEVRILPAYVNVVLGFKGIGVAMAMAFRKNVPSCKSHVRSVVRQFLSLPGPTVEALSAPAKDRALQAVLWVRRVV